MVKDANQRRGDEQDSKRVFRWGIGAVVAVALAVVLLNSFFSRPVTPAPSDATSTSTPASTPQPLGAGVPR